jgi:hypothetical protein
MPPTKFTAKSSPNCCPNALRLLPDVPQMHRAPSFRLFSGERVGLRVPPSGRWPAHQPRRINMSHGNLCPMNQGKLCPVHRGPLCAGSVPDSANEVGCLILRFFEVLASSCLPRFPTAQFESVPPLMCATASNSDQHSPIGSLRLIDRTLCIRQGIFPNTPCRFAGIQGAGRS